MKASSGTKRRWLASAIGAAVVVAGFLVLFRSPLVVVPPPKPQRVGPPIALSPGRTDELAMRDLAPLFLPTPFNAVPAPLKPHEPGASYFERDRAVHMLFDRDNPDLRLPPLVRPPAKPLDVLADVPPPLAYGIGRTDLTVPQQPVNGGHVDVFAASSHRSLFGATLSPDAAAPVAGRETLGWKPLEFAAAVDASGLVGPLILTRGSGVEEVDNHFRTYLAQTFRIGDRLPPGFYRIVVGP